ncbi:MAG: DMP19 family protein [Vicinamibacteria bacterium]|nr:DMP19 family protein [Vicinamibacteria bacterium]
MNSSKRQALVDAVVERIAALVAKAPEGGKIADARARAENELFRLVRDAGASGAQALIERLKASGHALEAVVQAGPFRSWREVRRDGRVLEIVVNPGPVVFSALVKWEVAVAPRPQKRGERARAALHEAFYARFAAAAGLGPEAGKPRPRRLAKGDRLVLLVGDLEADVNNGGFSQYLLNKGRRRAGDAARALEQIGAARTARWLRTALEKADDEAALGRLDTAFYDRPEDLAALCMRYVQPMEEAL